MFDSTAAINSQPLIDGREMVYIPTKRRVRITDLPAAVPVIRVLAARDFKVKYQQSILGPVWVVFQPLALLGAFMVAFRGLGHVQGEGVPYPVFALAGLSVWSFVQASLTIGSAAFLSNINLVKSTPCPRIAPIASAVISSTPSLAVTAGAAIIGSAVTGHLSIRALLLPFAVVWLLLLTASVVAISASVAVRYRDVISALPFLLQLGAFLAPVGYALSSLSPTLRVIVQINPITGLIEAFRWTMLSGFKASATPILVGGGVSSLLLLWGWRTFTYRETTMADVI